MSRFMPLALVIALMTVLLAPGAGPLAPVASVLAQGINPAAYVPADVAGYVEIRLDENLEADLQTLPRMWMSFSGASPTEIESAVAQVSIDTLLAGIFPNVTFVDDILPWLGDRAGAAAMGDPNAPNADVVMVLPITDSARAQAFLSGLTVVFESPARVGDALLYAFPQYHLAIAPDAVLVGTPSAVEAALDVRAGNSPALSDDMAFVQTWSALPPDPLLGAFVNGTWLSQEVMPEMPAGDQDMIREVWEMILRAHPAESPMEDALLAWPSLNGGAMALDLTDERLDVTFLYSLDAEYPGPALPTAGAGAGLLDLLPGSAFLALDSYDVTVTLGAGSVSFLALLGPAIGNVFENIVTELGGTPAPTPTPEPTPDVEEVFAEINQMLRQPEILEGLALLSGEYALAVFPAAGGQAPGMPPIGGALWLHTPDPDRVIAGLDTLLLTLRSPRENPVIVELLAQGLIGETEIAQLQTALAEVNMQRATDSRYGVDVTAWQIEGVEALAYGVLSDEVAFLAFGPGAATVVTAAARGDGTLPQSPVWPTDVYRDYGPNGELLLFVDLARVIRLMGGLNAPLGDVAEAFILGLDLQDDGFIQLRMTVVRPPVE